MMNEYKAYGLKLLENGYIPLPLKPGEKRPAINRWSEIQVDKKHVDTWVESLGDGGVGLRGGELVALDIDITVSDAVVTNLIAWCLENIGTPMIRVGKAPKVALFYRTDTPFSRRDSAYYGDDPKNAQHIEARSLDTQTVAFGKHPDTNQNYRWTTDSTPLNTPISKLPTVSPDQITELYEYLDELATYNKWPLQADLMPDSTDSGDWMKGKYEISDVDLITALGFIDADDYHRWVSVGMALYHQFDGGDQGLQMWDEWSQRSSKYEGTCDSKWNTFHDTGKRRTATVGSILHLAAAKGWKNPGVREAAVPAPEIEPPKKKALSFIELIQTEPPVRDWLIPGFIPAHKVCMLTAPGGTGKSTWVLQLAFSITTGLPLCGHWEIEKTGDVLILGAEDDMDDAHERGAAILESFMFTDELDAALQAANKRFHYLPMVGKPVAIKPKEKGEDHKNMADRIIEYANKHMEQCRLIVIDPVSRFKVGDENSQDDMTRFVEEIERIRTATGATIMIVHHANKDSMRSGGADEQYAARGASALTDGVRWQANMAKLHPDEAKDVGIRKEEAGHYVKLAVAKSNYTAPFEGVWLNRGDGGVLMAFDMDKQRRTKGKIEIEAVHQSIIDVIKSTDKILTRNDLKNNYAGKGGKIPVATRLVHGLVDDLVKQGILKEVASGRSGPSHGLKFVGGVVESNDDDGFLDV